MLLVIFLYFFDTLHWSLCVFLITLYKRETVYVCMHVCMCLCIYVCTYVFMDVLSACMYACHYLQTACTDTQAHTQNTVTCYPALTKSQIPHMPEFHAKNTCTFSLSLPEAIAIILVNEINAPIAADPANHGTRKVLALRNGDSISSRNLNSREN
jgi:hypothetical protein